ncbi:MAG TPA: tetraacyldisaccharide 4'-kinase [Candidatus Saccharimonadales bacterium]|nr:tetraacyldisaccharide 4'-kinase [Candidatus Saccharimonadales bacterium]
MAGSFERSWSGEPGTVPWTRMLEHVAFVYEAASSVARARAGKRRARLEGCHVLAIGNLTVGGTGKSTIARWLALEAVKTGGRAAILLRGHGAATPEPGVVPDFKDYPVEAGAARYGDEAVALRRGLPPAAVVAVDPDRARAGRAVRDGYGARVVILDDGWEQSGLRWDELWVAIDPRRPAGNGSLLPAGPLRRPASSLREATRAVFLLEERDETVPEATLAWLARTAPGLPYLRLRRTLCGTTALRSLERPEALAPGVKVAVLSGIGAPRRLERFLRAAGAELLSHDAYPDHARWEIPALESSLRRAERAGAAMILITEKDEPRWPSGLTPALPLRVIRTGVQPLDSVEEALRPIQEPRHASRV